GWPSRTPLCSAADPAPQRPRQLSRLATAYTSDSVTKPARSHRPLSCRGWPCPAPPCRRPDLSAHLLSCPDSPCPHLLTAEPNRLPLSVVPIRHRTPPLDSLPLSITRSVVPIRHVHTSSPQS